MAGNADNSTSAKAQFDPGWNDPPKLTYNPGPPPNVARNILNKRVPFPLTNNENPVIPQPSTVPHFSNIEHTLPSKPVRQTEVCKELEDFDSVSVLDDVLCVLNELLENNKELGNRISDIKKRLNIMENMWRDNKLDKQIQWKMKCLTKELKEDRPVEADHFQKELMIDHAGNVSTWMVGVRHIINHCIAKHELLNIDKD